MIPKLNAFKNKNKYDMVLHDFLIEYDQGKLYEVNNYLANMYEYYLVYSKEFNVSNCELANEIIREVYQHQALKNGQIFSLYNISKIYTIQYLRENYKCDRLEDAPFSNELSWNEFLLDEVGTKNEHLKYYYFIKEVMNSRSEVNQFARNIHLMGNFVPFNFDLNQDNFKYVELYLNTRDDKYLKNLVRSVEELEDVHLFFESFSDFKEFAELNYLDHFEGIYQKLPDKRIEDMTLTELEFSLSKVNEALINRSELIASALLNQKNNRKR